MEGLGLIHMANVILHVGCGGERLPEWLSGCDEVRLDISPDNEPDIVASMTDMGEIGQFDGVFCSHALEHLHQHEVGIALSEFHRVLKPGGAAYIFVPDLEDVQPTEQVMYVSPAGPITGRDMYYGLASIIADFPYMAHKTGFVSATLAKALEAAGFEAHTRRLPSYNLLGVGVKR